MISASLPVASSVERVVRYLVLALIFLGAGSGMGQVAWSAPSATPPRLDPNEPYKVKRCTGTVTGRVSSSTTIETPRLVCGGFGSAGSDNYGNSNGGESGRDNLSFNSGACKRPGTLWAAEANLSAPVPSCTDRPWFTMTVQLANPADAGEMPVGRLVTLKGDFRHITQNKVSYLLVQNARVLYADPFGR